MKKNLWVLSGIAMCLCVLGCNEESGQSIQKDTECTKNCTVEGGRAEGCFIINGEQVCKQTCSGKVEGENAPACYHNDSAGPDAKDNSVTDTCAKDELGKLYVVSSDSQICDNGCNQETGSCNQGQVVTECTKECLVNGGRSESCFVINGEQVCKQTCFGNVEGENAPACYRNGSLGPNAKDNSVTDTCAKDELGKFYVVSSESHECDNGCNQETGSCNAGQVVTECTKQCNMVGGGRGKGCFVINGEESCKDTCLGKAEGDNVPVCYKNASLGPNAEEFSLSDSCVKDDLGHLYSVGDHRDKCDDGCNQDTGRCNTGSVVKECKKNCEVEGGRPRGCFLINGVETCKQTCLGNAEGENESQCYQAGSVGPDADMYSVTDVCVKDELGHLYMESTSDKKCDNGCKNGVCLTPGIACTKMCMVAGGAPKDCFVINDEQVCANKCLGKNPGVNAPVCYSNASLGPNAKMFSTIDTCKADQLGNLYSVGSEAQECKDGCTDGYCNGTI